MHEKGQGSKENLSELKAFWSSFKIYFQKNFLHAMAVLGYLPKLKRGLELADACFLDEYFHESVS